MARENESRVTFSLRMAGFVLGMGVATGGGVEAGKGGGEALRGVEVKINAHKEYDDKVNESNRLGKEAKDALGEYSNASPDEVEKKRLEFEKANNAYIDFSLVDALQEKKAAGKKQMSDAIQKIARGSAIIFVGDMAAFLALTVDPRGKRKK